MQGYVYKNITQRNSHCCYCSNICQAVISCKTGKMININDYLVKGAPNTAYYIPNFITEQQEKHLLENVYNVPKPKWTQLSNRRLQDYGGIPDKRGLLPEKIPTWLQQHMNRISELGIFVAENGETKQANHCLLNEYQPGQGIMSHFDGPVFTPVISTLSIGSHTVLEFFEECSGVRTLKCKLLLERNSLVVLRDDLYKKYLHGISEVTKDVVDERCVNLLNCGRVLKIGDVLERDTRVSLTIRNVPKVFKCNLLGFMKK